MRDQNHVSKQRLSGRYRATRSALLGRCAALSLLIGALACSSSNDSKVSASMAGASSSTAGFPDIIVPNGDAGVGGNGYGGGDSSSMGGYMLPAGFTKEALGGYKLGAPIDPSMAGSAGASAGGASSSCGSQILGVVRDFKGINEPDGHPDFEHFSGNDASPGIVKADLGSDQKPVYASAADSPFVDPKNGQQTTTKANFDEWYRATTNVNKPYIVYFYFEPSNGVSTFQSTAFFPLDGAGWGNTCNEPDADSTGANPTCKKQNHNFGFTTEIHTRFHYKGAEIFSFTGDDDLWVFINNKLAIDLGGLHQSRTKQILLDDEAKELGITVNNDYALDLFHAERHTDASNFRVDTNLSFTNCGTVIEEPPVK